MKFTRSTINKLQCVPGEKERIVYDDDVAGFGLRLHPKGTRTWFVQYRFGKKQRRLRLGTTANLDPDEARNRARNALAKVRLGVDPASQVQEATAQANLTFGATIPRYLAHVASRQRAGHHEDTKRYLERHWKPLADRGVALIDRASVAARLQEIAKESGPFAANRARAALSAFYSWCIGEGLAPMNPVVGTNKPAVEVRRDRVLSDPELALVWRESGAGEFGRIVRLLILTAARREEIGGALWSELQGTTLRIAAERAKNGIEHDIALPPLALALLTDLPKRDGRDLIFGTGEGGFAGWSKAKAALDARMLKALGDDDPKARLVPWRLHDLRRTAATRMAELGVLPHVVEAVLAHISGHKAGVAGIYNRASYREEKREALALWAARVGEIVGASW